jgi:adenine deaminase
MRDGHIDHIIRLAVKHGQSAVTAIRMATIQAATYFGLPRVGAVAPGYRADVLVLDDLDTFAVRDVYSGGEKIVSDGVTADFEAPVVSEALQEVACHSFHVDMLTEKDFHLEEKSEHCRAIEIIPGQLLTRERVLRVDWSKNNGVDVEQDVLKLAVIERHKNTGHIGLGFICGVGIKNGAIASSVSHDSHNLIVIGSNESDMALAANHVRTHGGNVVVSDGRIIAEMALPIAGLMTDRSGEEIAQSNERVRRAVYELGVPQNIEPFMNMAFVSLPVIPSLKMTTQGLFDVDGQKRVSLYV